MKIKSIEIHNFKSIKNYKIDFEDTKGLWEITGPVGSGKTSIGEALLYGLFGTVKDKNIPNLISWGEKKMNVVVELESKGINIIINRSAGSGSKLLVYINGVLLNKSNKKDIQKELEENYFDISKLTLETLCIISFNGFKSLATLTPADSRKFLNSTFSLSVLSDLAALTKTERSELGTQLDNINRDINGLNNQKKVYDNFLEKTEKFTQKDLNSFVEQQDEKLNIYNKKKSEYSNEYNKFVGELSTEQKSLGAIEVKGRTVKKNIDFISKGICPTCGAPLDQSHLEEYKSERVKLGEEYKCISKSINELKEKMDKITVSSNKELDVINKEIFSLRDQITKAREYLESEKKCNINIKEISDKLEVLHNDLKEVEKEYNEWQELGSILENESRQKIMSNIIPSLNKKICEYSAELGFPFSIVFNDQFKCIIKYNSLNMEVPISSLSTGQLKTVDLVIILSILDILMNGVDFNIHFLDELFSNMHEELRGTMCEILKRKMNPKDTIFVISHANLPSNSIDGRIEVSLNNGNSSFYSN